MIEDLKKPTSPESCRQLFRWELPPHPNAPAEIKENQQPRARRLLQCIGMENVPQEPLSNNPGLWTELDGHILEAFQSRPTDRKKLVCLSWAASVLQGHKHDFWGFTGALDYSMEDSVTYGTTEVVVEPYPAKQGCSQARAVIMGLPEPVPPVTAQLCACTQPGRGMRLAP